ncbi:MAG: TetR/AcrR family transcriptional regulator [Phycisphaerae bacterium]|nr:TetR/AcrR family transcriptional regulator [Gemmatimonadaceae bacterium]
MSATDGQGNDGSPYKGETAGSLVAPRKRVPRAKSSSQPPIAGGGESGTQTRERRSRADDPRVVRTRAAVVDAARTLFVRQGYAGTTMEDIAALAGLTKRTLYNNYPDKDALFTQIVAEVIAYAEAFAHRLHEQFAIGITRKNIRETLDDLAQRLALGIVRPEVVALRRLLIGESREFPALAREYFDRAPGAVIDALAAGFLQLHTGGLLRAKDAQRAAAQFAYLVAGEPLDRAMLVGTVPSREHIIACAREGVVTFLARYGLP